VANGNEPPYCKENPSIRRLRIFYFFNQFHCITKRRVLAFLFAYNY
jgi:hypothetical protein